MKRIALIFLVPFNLWAGTPQVALFTTVGGLHTTSTSTSQIFGSSGGGFDVTVDRNTGIAPIAGTFSNFRFCSNTAPGVGKSYALTAQLGTRNTDSPITCTISGTNLCCYDITHSSSVVAGDLIRIKSVPSGTPTAATAHSGSMHFMPANEGEYMVTGAQTSVSASTAYCPLVGAVGARTTQTDTAIPMSPPGTFDRLYVEVATAPGAGNSWVFTFMTNGSASSITCTISGAAARTCTDLTNSSSTIRGDTVNVRIALTGTPTATTFSVGMRFRPTNRGEFPILGNTFNSVGTAANSWVNVNGGNGLNTTSENLIVSTATSPSPGLILKNATYSVSTAPGASKSFTYTLRRNYANPTGGPTSTISGTAKTAKDDGYIVVSESDNIVWQLAPSGTPTAGMFHAGMTGFFTQPSIAPVFP